MEGHVNLGSYAPSTAPIVPVQSGAGFTSYGQMGSAPQSPTAEMGKMGAGCRRKRMGAKRGTRCFCNGKMVKSSRCK